MSSGRRRIVLDLPNRLKQWRFQMASARTIHVSSAVGIPQLPSMCPCNQNRHLSTAAKLWRGTPSWPVTKIRFFENRFIRNDLSEIGYTVDVASLLFTPERDFLVKNNGQKIKVDELRRKTLVLFIVPLDEQLDRPGGGDTWDMMDASNELLRIGSAVEFVFVPVRLNRPAKHGHGRDRQEALFRHLLSTMPFPAIPFSDAQPREGPVVQTFSLDAYGLDYSQHLPYWVVIDPTNTVVATRFLNPRLFKLFGGAELHPLSQERIWDLQASHQTESRVQRINKWDQLLASDTRDFVLSSNGDKVPISSLKGKLVGLYFCENIPHPPRMKVIKKVYEEAKSRGLDFEIVQITFHYHPFNAKHLDTDPTVQQCFEDVSWLTLPFKDPSCRKLQRILHCVEEEDEYWRTRDCPVAQHWVGDSLVLIHPPQAEADRSSGVLNGLSGAEILERWGIEGYPFTRQALSMAEYEVQKREVRLKYLFPLRKYLLRSVGPGFVFVDAIPQLFGKRVLVLFVDHSISSYYAGFADFADFVWMLKSEYLAQLEDNVAEERKFEVVYVSAGGSLSYTQKFTIGMPWLVEPFSSYLERDLFRKVFKARSSYACAAAFDAQGELIAKACHLPKKKEGDKFQFPFIDQDLEGFIRGDVEVLCDVSNLYY